MNELIQEIDSIPKEFTLFQFQIDGSILKDGLGGSQRFDMCLSTFGKYYNVNQIGKYKLPRDTRQNDIYDILKHAWCGFQSNGIQII